MPYSRDHYLSHPEIKEKSRDYQRAKRAAMSPEELTLFKEYNRLRQAARRQKKRASQLAGDPDVSRTGENPHLFT